MTGVIALIGHPVAHSVSPEFQQAAIDALGLDARFEAWDTPPDWLPGVIERLRGEDHLGANVTVPHKIEAMRLVDRPDALAERVGAINTIVNRGGTLEATNTDVHGIRRALEGADAELQGAQVLLIGAGGAARAVVVAMQEAGAAGVTIANRSLGRAQELTALGDERMAVSAVALDPADAALREAAASAQVIVQSTSVGMLHGPAEDESPLPADWFRPDQVAFDLVYVPEETPFLRDARAAGARVVGGLDMLIHQGAAAFALWTGQEPPIDVMVRAAREALATRGR